MSNVNVSEVQAVLRKLRRGKPLTVGEVTTLSEYAGKRMTRRDVTKFSQYMKKLDDKINYCVADGVMSDALSLRDANTHHEQVKTAMEAVEVQIGLRASDLCCEPDALGCEPRAMERSSRRMTNPDS